MTGTLSARPGDGSLPFKPLYTTDAPKPDAGRMVGFTLGQISLPSGEVLEVPTSSLIMYGYRSGDKRHDGAVQMEAACAVAAPLSNLGWEIVNPPAD